MSATVEAIFIGERKGESMHRVPAIEVRAGQGIETDRYFREQHEDPAREITLIEAEAIEALNNEVGIPFDPSESRRNLLTRGVGLNDLVGCEFSVGGVRLRGIRLCHPCAHLQKLTRPGVLKGLVNRGGLRAQIVTSGAIHEGDAVVVD